MQQKRVEVAANRCSRKIPFQKVLEIQQENTFGGVLFQAEGCNIIKTELHHQFSNFSEDFQNTFSIEHRQTAASKTVKQFKPHAKANKHGTGIRVVCFKKRLLEICTRLVVYVFCYRCKTSITKLLEQLTTIEILNKNP